MNQWNELQEIELMNRKLMKDKINSRHTTKSLSQLMKKCNKTNNKLKASAIISKYSNNNNTENNNTENNNNENNNNNNSNNNSNENENNNHTINLTNINKGKIKICYIIY